MINYEVKPVVSDYGVFENGELKLILNCKNNAEKIVNILETDIKELELSENNKKDFLTVTIRCIDLEHIVKAVKIANNAIYSKDSDTYLSALEEVCTTLLPKEFHDEVGKRYLDFDSKKW